MTDYKPIDCARHSQLELHIMHADPILLEWIDQHQQKHSRIIVASNILAVKGDAEYLEVQDSNGESARIRLDKIVSFKLHNNH